MSSAKQWNYEKAIPAFKEITKDPINLPYSPYGLPYYVIVATMMKKSKTTLVNADYDFKIEGGVLTKMLGPSVYPGSKMFLNSQPRPVFRAWHEYIESTIPIVEADYPEALADLKTLSDKITTTYNKYLAENGALSDEAIAEVAKKVGVFKSLPDESYSYSETSGFHLELRQTGGGTEIDVGMDIKTGKTNTTIMSRALLTNDSDYNRFTKFITTRKKDLENYARKQTGQLKSSKFVQSEKQLDADIKVLEGDITAFYDKHCKTGVEMLRNANQLQSVI